MNGNFGGGSGTATDPYIVEDWADFAAIRDSSKHYKLSVDLDANDRNDGVWESLNIVFASLDGDSHHIRNINYTGTTSAILFGNKNLEVKDVYFEQCVCQSGSLIMTGGSSASVHDTFTRCEFTVVAQALFQRGSAGKAYLESCSISIRNGGLMKNSDMTNRGNDAKRTSIRFTNGIESNSSSGASFGAFKFHQCEIIGDINATSGTAYFSGTNNSFVADFHGTLESATFANGDANQPTLFDIDKLGCTPTGTGLIAAHTSQCSTPANAEWLQAQGFPVVVVPIGNGG